jgi:hypothetical protein
MTSIMSPLFTETVGLGLSSLKRPFQMSARVKSNREPSQ